MSGLTSQMILGGLLRPLERVFAASLADLGLEVAAGASAAGEQPGPDDAGAGDAPALPGIVFNRSSHDMSQRAPGPRTAARTMHAVQGRSGRAPELQPGESIPARATDTAGQVSPGAGTTARVPRLIPPAHSVLRPVRGSAPGARPVPDHAPAAAHQPGHAPAQAAAQRHTPIPGQSSGGSAAPDRSAPARPASAPDGPDIAALLARRLEPSTRPGSPASPASPSASDADGEHASGAGAAGPGVPAVPAQAGRPRLRLRPVRAAVRRAAHAPDGEPATTGATAAAESPASPAQVSDVAAMPAARPAPAAFEAASALPAASRAGAAPAPAATHGSAATARAASHPLQPAGALSPASGPRADATPDLRSGRARAIGAGAYLPAGTAAPSPGRVGSAPGTMAAAPASQPTGPRPGRTRLRVQPRPGALPADRSRLAPGLARPAPGSLAAVSPPARPAMRTLGDAPGPETSVQSSGSELRSPAAEAPAITAEDSPRPTLVPLAGAAPAPASTPAPTGPAPMTPPGGITTTRPSTSPAPVRARASVRPGRAEAAASAAAPALDALPADPIDPRLERALTEVLRRAARRQGIDV
jgi:hypothetical protein